MLRQCQSNSVVCPIEKRVILSHEDVSKDPHGTAGLGNIKVHHSSDALVSGEFVVDLHNIVSSSERVTLALHNIGDLREMVQIAAVTFDMHLWKQLACGFKGSSEERGTRIDNKLAVALLVVTSIQSLSVNFDIVHANSPIIVLINNIVVVEFRGHSFGVWSTETELRIVTLSSVREVEGKGGVGKQFSLRDVVEHWGGVVCGQWRHCQAEDTVRLAKLRNGKESDMESSCPNSRYLSLGEVGCAEDLVVNVDVVEMNSVTRETGLDDTSSILNTSMFGSRKIDSK